MKSGTAVRQSWKQRIRTEDKDYQDKQEKKGRAAALIPIETFLRMPGNELLPFGSIWNSMQLWINLRKLKKYGLAFFVRDVIIVLCRYGSSVER